MSIYIRLKQYHAGKQLLLRIEQLLFLFREPCILKEALVSILFHVLDTVLDPAKPLISGENELASLSFFLSTVIQLASSNLLCEIFAISKHEHYHDARGWDHHDPRIMIMSRHKIHFAT